MAVLIEAISVVVRREAIEQRFPGGWDGFVGKVPNKTLCSDGKLARVGFMSPLDVQGFVVMLQSRNLTFQDGNKAIHLAVVDQQRGPTCEADWLEFARIPYRATGRFISAAWLFEGLDTSVGAHLQEGGPELATPAGWRFEESLSAESGFVPNEDVPDRLELVRREDGVNVFRDRRTGKLAYQAGEAIKPAEPAPSFLARLSGTVRRAIKGKR